MLPIYILSLPFFSLLNPIIILPITILLSALIILKENLINKIINFKFKLIEVIILLCILISSLLRSVSLSYVFGFLSSILFFYTAPILLFNRIKSKDLVIDKAVYYTKISFFIHSAILIVEFIFIKSDIYLEIRGNLRQFIGGELPMGTRAQGFLLEPFYSSVLLIVQYLFIINKSNSGYIFSLIGGLILRISLITTGSASALIFILFAYWAVYNSCHNKLNRAFFVIDTSLIIFFSENVQFKYTIENFINKLSVGDESSISRIDSILFFKEYLINSNLVVLIFGSGLGASSLNSLAHFSTILTIWYDIGLISIVYIAIFFVNVKNKNTSNSIIYIMPIILMLVTTSVFWIPSNLFYIALFVWLQKN
jgi:hypothetical protein